MARAWGTFLMTRLASAGRTVIFIVILIATFFTFDSARNPSLVVAAEEFPSKCGRGNGTLPFPRWYKYLGSEGSGKDCRVVLIKSGDDIDIVKNGGAIALAILEIMTTIAGLVAAGYMIFGSFQYIMSQGSPEGLRGAKSTITNAVIGFIIILLSIAIIQFLGKAITTL